MEKLQKHLRNMFLAGVFAAIPIAVTIFVIWYIEKTTRELFGFTKPFVAILLAFAGIYVLGVIVSSLIGRFFLGLIDRLLLRLPVLSELYKAWKHISITPGGKEGIFAKVVLIPDGGGGLKTLGFTSGEAIQGDPQTCCVFVPAAPNPTNGRLYFVRMSDCRFLDMSVEEAFKMILSGGNYVPSQIGPATTRETAANGTVL